MPPKKKNGFKETAKAAEQGNTEAQYELGRMYFLGRDVARMLLKLKNGLKKQQIKEMQKPKMNWGTCIIRDLMLREIIRKQ